MGEWDAVRDERDAERNKQLKRIADAIEGQNKVLADIIAKVLANQIVNELKQEDKDYELRNGTGAKLNVNDVFKDDPKVDDMGFEIKEEFIPNKISFGPPEDAIKVNIPKAKEMTITVSLNKLSDSGLAYNFTWKEGDRDIWLPKGLVDNMNKGFGPILGQPQAIKVPTNIMRDK